MQAKRKRDWRSFTSLLGSLKVAGKAMRKLNLKEESP